MLPSWIYAVWLLSLVSASIAFISLLNCVALGERDRAALRNRAAA